MPSAIPNIEVSLVYQQFVARYFEEQIHWETNTVQQWLHALLALRLAAF